MAISPVCSGEGVKANLIGVHKKKKKNLDR